MFLSLSNYLKSQLLKITDKLFKLTRFGKLKTENVIAICQKPSSVARYFPSPAVDVAVANVPHVELTGAG